jgi:hypothetical protein
MRRSPAAHPRKRLGRGVIDGPQTIIAKTRGEREGYTCCLLSLEILIPSQSFCLPPYYAADASYRTMTEQMGLSVDVESSEAFNVGNPPPTDRSLVGLLSNPPVPPLEVDHHRSSCCLSSFNHSTRAMLTIVFVFIFNLTSIWN